MGIVSDAAEEAVNLLIEESHTDTALHTLTIGVIDIEVKNRTYQVQITLNPNDDERLPLDQITVK